ncbi:MAG: transcription-repair coupling factor [Phycisphaerae bacterium]|nr:transcription-repair coupling factor [Phycisphaerae bacterium]
MNAPTTDQSMPGWHGRILDNRVIKDLLARIESSGTILSGPSCGSSATVLAGCIHAASEHRPAILVVAHLDQADDAVDQLRSSGFDAMLFPALQVLPGESSLNLDLVSDRLRLARMLHGRHQPGIIVAPVAALMQGIPIAAKLDSMTRQIQVGHTLALDELSHWFFEAGFERVDSVESPGEFAIRGGLIDVFTPGSQLPTRIDLFAEVVESIHEIDLATQASDRRLEHAELMGASIEMLSSDQDMKPMMDFISSSSVTILDDIVEIIEQARGYFDRVEDAGGVLGPPAVLESLAIRSHAIIQCTSDPDDQEFRLPFAPLPEIPEKAQEAFELLRTMSTDGASIILACRDEAEFDRMAQLVAEHVPESNIEIIRSDLASGFIFLEQEGHPLVLVPQHELLHRYASRRRKGLASTRRARDAFLQFVPGDYVVHRDHGIGRFVSLGPIPGEPGDGTQEFLTLEYAGKARLHVPASRIELIQKYVGAGNTRPKLATLGGRRWKKQKEEVEEAVRDLASQMLRIQAAREASPGIRFPVDTTWQREFEADFPFQETEDQLLAIDAVKEDMQRRQPMDRLICGDVGFGKTEVAMRAAFKAVEAGHQVALLVPTTVLADQHERSFGQRFGQYPFRIECLSRFKDQQHQREVIGELSEGKVDILIGTHRLLSKDVRFADLGLVIIDEEQRFGVEHKHRLLQFRATADVLTLSATPIPRTLHMAMLGLRDISALATPPPDRRSIVTEIIQWNDIRIRRAIQRELAREGQVFFVHNRVHDIQRIADRLKSLVPDARILIGHGQMPAQELESVMLSFSRRQADVLLCTSIIESGIDIPTANTIIIDQADLFGLADLHQLRGRVGRHRNRAYCYLVMPEQRQVSQDAMKRLQAVEGFSMLGAGFKIALADLEIRGAGNLLGSEQSGHITAVGYEMYCRLLEEAVADLSHDRRTSPSAVSVDLGVGGAIPRGYIRSDLRRMEAYKRIAEATSESDLDHLETDMSSAWGPIPESTKRLVQLGRLRLAAAAIDVRSIVLHDQDVVFRTLQPEQLKRRLEGVGGSVRQVGQPEADGLQEIFFRPPGAWLEGTSLPGLLRGQLE